MPMKPGCARFETRPSGRAKNKHSPPARGHDLTSHQLPKLIPRGMVNRIAGETGTRSLDDVCDRPREEGANRDSQPTCPP